jgi:glycosyltransferase involved in cell wall biosynthesis
MKILHIINNLGKGGAEKLLTNTLPHFVDKTDEIALLQLSDRHTVKEYAAHLNAKDVKVHTLGSGAVRNPLLIFAIRRFIKKTDYDIVHVHLFPALYWVAIASYLPGKLKPKFVFTEHSTQNRRIHNKLLRPLESLIYKRYHTVVAVSEQVKRLLSQWLRHKVPVEVIPNGTDTDFIKKIEPLDLSALPKIVNTNTSALFILMAARFAYPKDHETLIRALSLLPANFHIVFAGEGETETRMKNLSVHLQLTGRVHFLGYRSDALQLMKSVHVNVLSSHYEGMSGAAIEAMASGIPFLGSDVPGINDVVPNQQFLFKPSDPQDLAEKICKCTEDPVLCSQMSETALLHIKKFDTAFMVNNHVALYKRLLSDH